MKQYPHKLFMDVPPDWDSEQNDDGSWSVETMTRTLIADCREETNGRGSAIQTTDGRSQVYASIIFLPVSCPDFAYGKMVYIKDSETATKDRASGKVLKFDRGQLHCRIWI